ncbi:HAD family phosphatase [Streptomyces noursei]|uniref:HAD family phosphatase n=1 Tax=Streptomyces noursei TaxID=1971 RepID=UPI00332D9F9D
MGVGGSGEPGGADGGPDGPAILWDVDGVLSPDHRPAAATERGERLGMPQHTFLAALFAGNDDRVLIGQTGQGAWWRMVRRRLGVIPALMAEIRRDLAARQRWDAAPVAGVRAQRGRARTTLASNAWPELRRAGVAAPARALFVDDTAGHVRAARALGMAGHLHADTRGTLARIEGFVGTAAGGG